jgi:tRNA(Arg) A34 adenosine deaminase TadA
MNKALENAQKAFDQDEVPVGCVIVKDNQIISSAYNQTIIAKNCLAHAEILAINQAISSLQTNRLNDCDIYITLEPCPMCLTAISMTKIQRIFYGANDPKFGAVESNPLFSFNNLALFKPEIYSGINANESANLLSSFFAKKR